MKTPDAGCKRGRPREFDADKVLSAALGVFWKHGYDGTSMNDLTEAMGINRPSLYAAFGNKLELFRHVLAHYAAKAGSTMAGAMSESTARAAVERVMGESIESMTRGKEPTGCFLVVAAMACGTEADCVRREVAKCRLGPTELLRGRFELAVAEKELPVATDVTTLAAYFGTVLHGLSVQAASGVDRATLRRVAARAMAAWPAVGSNRRAAKDQP